MRGRSVIGVWLIGFALLRSPLVNGQASHLVPQAVTDEALAALGRSIFFDPSLSASGKLACATCHDPRYAYGPPPGRALARGGQHADQAGTRAVPSLRYLRDSPPFALEHHFIDGDIGPVGGFTWDGRADSIHDQARLPLFAPNEMANASVPDVARKLSHSGYAKEFRARFGKDVFEHPDRTLAGALDALDAFEQTPKEFFPFSSRYDAFLRGEIDLTAQEERGIALFKDPNKGNCASCHLSSTRNGAAPIFTDYDFANVGVPRNPRITANADPAYFDLGLCGPARQDLKDRQEYCGFFRAPGLRNVAVRDAFFHNGVFSSLRQAVEFYVNRDLQPERFYSRNADGSVHKSDDLPEGVPDTLDHDPPLDRTAGDAPALTDADIDDVVAFLRTLTDSDVALADRTAQAPWAAPQNAALAAQSADEYAWRTFIALNWPADTQRRAADARRLFGAQGPAVWETWQNARDVFLENGSEPGSWSPGPRRPQVADAHRFELLSLKDPARLRHIVSGHMVPLDDPVASSHRLTEIRMNRLAFDYIRAHELYNVEGQLAAVESADGVEFPPGATLIKARWRPIRADERARYHTLRVRFADGSIHLYGLTALHIETKALPRWLWATFEHMDNRTLAGADGWRMPSRDSFACGHAALDCGATPQGLGIVGTVWANYRLRGTLTAYLDAAGQPTRLASSDLEAGMQESSSCISCHARSALGVRAGVPVRPSIFRPAIDEQSLQRVGFVGEPEPAWFADPEASEGAPSLYRPLDFVWSLALAHSRLR